MYNYVIFVLVGLVIFSTEKKYSVHFEPAVLITTSVVLNLLLIDKIAVIGNEMCV